MNTTEPMPQEQLDAIQRRVESATEGPWAHWAGREQWANCIKSDTDEGMYTVAEVVSEASDAKFISRAREDIPALLAEVQRLRALTTVDDDMVERATQALWSTAVGEVGQGALDGARPGTRVTWDEVHPDTKESWRRDARAALNAVLGTALVTEEEV